MFELRVNGQKVWSSERQVTRIAMQSGRGEIGAAGISATDGVVDIFIEEVSPAGPVRLDQLDEVKRREVAGTAEGLDTGSAGYSPALDANKTAQGVGIPGEDIPAGGPDVGEKPETFSNLPETSPSGSDYNPPEEEETLEEEASVGVISEEENGETEFSINV